MREEPLENELAPAGSTTPGASEAAASSAGAAVATVEGATSADAIVIRGARTHNLRNIDLDIPRDQLVVITGPSGSGKSSLAFDTLFAEGQRQYIESLSVYARQFLHQLERPDVDLIEGLEPTVCIDQRPGNQNPRSTVATMTEIYDYLRLLMARCGEATCYQCGAPIRQQSPQQVQERLLELPEGTKTIIMSPLVRGRRGAHAEVFQQIRKAGFVRARVDGQVYDLDTVPELNPKQNHHIDAVVDRVIIRAGIESRLTESIQLAVKHSEGLVAILYYDDHSPEAQQEAAASGNGNGHNGHPPGVWRDVLYSTRHACPDCKISFEELEPRTFSFNSPYGACPDCEGLGVRTEFDPELVLPEMSLSVATGAIAPWKTGTPGETKKRRAALAPFLTANKLEAETPLAEYKPKQLEKLLHGDGKKFLGLLTMLEKELATATRENKRKQLETFRGTIVCRTCGGSRLRREANSVRLGGKGVHEITRLTIGEAREFFASLTLGPELEPIGAPLVEEIEKRLAFLDKVGVTYLALDRAADTLSGGELQRVRLATCIGSGLVGVCYVLDEPSIGLHPRDNQRLIEALRDLQQQGNTVIVVEHDEAIMRQADWLIDIGPGAGQHGGQIVAQGMPRDVQASATSITGNYLSGREKIAVPAKRRRASKTRSITLEGVATNNLKHITVHFPLNTLCCVTGVSGSGKSSLVNETLARALVRRLGGVAPKPGPHTSLRGASQIDKIIEIDQSPIGRSPRSNPATYVGAFDEIRKIFAATREAKQFGFKANRFSFNVEGGRCEHCQGQGVERIEMNFLPDLYVTCSECDGKRFNRQTLAVKWRGKTIADILAMSVDEATAFFANFTNIHRLLASLADVGLGYLGLGQSSTTLSGGEAQRVKLATELARTETGSTLYLLDEPTTGLHFDDIKKLLDVLTRLVDKGNTVIVIEHNLDVIKTADWLIDLGPEGGAAGGYISAVGTPEELAFRLDDNHTGRYLRALLETKRG
jgi:excinuclease ABC subunit A